MLTTMETYRPQNYDNVYVKVNVESDCLLESTYHIVAFTNPAYPCATLAQPLRQPLRKPFRNLGLSLHSLAPLKEILAHASRDANPDQQGLARLAKILAQPCAIEWGIV